MNGCFVSSVVVRGDLVGYATQWAALLLRSRAALIQNGTQGFSLNTGRFTMFSVITNIYNKKTKGPPLMVLFTVTGKLNKCF
jgi:hypothetical protein